MSILLVADIGGTKIDFAFFDERSAFIPVAEGQLISAHYSSCAQAIAACLDNFPGKVDFASLAVAGPVSEQQVRFTNLPWQTGAAALEEEFGFAGVVLANDLVALAEGVPLLGRDDLVTIKPGKSSGRSGVLVVAPGTGLGAAFINRDAPQARVQDTEAGHLSFAPRTEMEVQLLTFLRQQHGHVTFEMVCSGTGLANLVFFLPSRGLAMPAELAAKSRESTQLGPLLAQRALAPDMECPFSRQVFTLFFDILAEFCGNLALALLPGAGIYLGGGMLPRLDGLFDKEQFARRFEDRGRMKGLVTTLPVFLITHPRPAMLGGWRLGRRTFYDEE